jgi:ABC-type uncharacterized transport system permease subunit
VVTVVVGIVLIIIGKTVTDNRRLVRHRVCRMS